MIHAIGLVELTSIAQGIECADIMVKTADVTILVAKTICPGKYIVMVSGDVSGVQQSVNAGIDLGAETVVDSFVIPNVHPSILPAIGNANRLYDIKALGIIETYSVASLIEAADAAVKAGDVEPMLIHLAFGIGGKSYTVLTGEVASVKAAVEEGSAIASEKGLLIRQVVIPRPAKQLIESLA
ncbi:BMC domain-containing protein [Desulfosporosinus sp. BICA1-9]|uniref:BMC domain-containing protein n=1 Tax=Desulfosporosinus sp. BICA1-9 TaxID=1531958 RepID=UPI00054C7179|nr:BMC domain-containing protein [Desulfosporosinus sp. BICA1-9]KJS47396.1 MAG: propanediol utilization protein [Peptococcaceae bacterium BRH_c23]HBW34345.1 BMC domain-containing protein [Desulfosporosinus sp.]KJS80332.1 MAG: propanediol utilization protein [Desulfosporosinus sp. BICA1-9]KJS86250.1 MAG: propanediol utilization protein [Desulfosporosinus sp. BICA1-9]HBW39114.1 BMC domain-containing protein [Desulfosporosinus sp.]